MSKLTGVLLSILVLGIEPLARADLLDEDDFESVPPADAPTPTRTPTIPAPDPEVRPSEVRPAPPKPKSTVKPKPAPAPNQSRVTERDDQVGLAPQKERKKGSDHDATEPVSFTSQGLKGLRTEGMVELLKDVVVVQGGLRLEADQAKVFFDEASNEVQRIEALGNVKVFRKDEESGEDVKAYGDKMTFLNSERKVLLTGDARLWNGPDLVKGKEITYELDTGWVWADKVEGLVNPGQR